MIPKKIGWILLGILTAFGCSADETRRLDAATNSGLSVSIVSLTFDMNNRVKLKVNYNNSSKDHICVFPHLGHSVVIEPVLHPGAFLIRSDVEGQRRPQMPLQVIGAPRKIDLPPQGNEDSDFLVNASWFNFVVGLRPDGSSYSDIAKSGKYRIGLKGYVILCSDESATPREFQKVMQLPIPTSKRNVYRFQTKMSDSIDLSFLPIKDRVILEDD